MPEAGISTRNLQHELDHAMPAAAHAKLGMVLTDIITAYNSLVAKYNALVAHIDAGAVAGLGTGNVAAYGNATTVGVLGSR